MQLNFLSLRLPQSGATGLDRIGLGWLSRSSTARTGRLTLLLCTPGFTPTRHDGLATARRDGVISRQTCAGWRVVARRLGRQADAGGFDPWVLEGDRLHGPDTVWDVLWPGADVD